MLASNGLRFAIARLQVGSSKVSGSGTFVRHSLRALQKRYDAALEEYQALSDLCDHSVARWVWTTAPRYNLDPLFFFNSDVSVGKLAPAPPKDPKGYTAYGFSGENRIVAERQYLTDLEGLYYKGFYREEVDRTIGYYFHFDPAVGCVNCSQLVFEASAPAYFQRWAQMGSVSCTYITVDRKIRSFTESFREDDGPQQKLSGELRYPDDGRIEVWTRWPGAVRAKRTFCGVAPAENPFLR
jgi:hypothetical protein